MKDTSDRPLAGLRVLDFTAMLAGPACTRWLADLGAEVIKIEPLQGEYMRFRPPRRQDHSAYFGQMNCGKRSVAMDLRRPECQEIARRLAARSDILVESFRPGVMARFGLGYETVSRISPRLVYCSISGFGQSGSAAARPAYAQIIHAASGYDLTHLAFQDAGDRPANTGIYVADVLTGVFALSAIQTALLRAGRDGRGTHIDVALMDSMFSLMQADIQDAQFPGPRKPVSKPSRVLDGFVMIAPATDKNFGALYEVMGRPDWTRSPEYSTTTGRLANWDALFARIDEWTSLRQGEEVERLMLLRGVPCTRYRTLAEAMRAPEVLERGVFAEAADAAGTYLVSSLPFRFSDSPTHSGGGVPAIGQDTDDVLTEIAGIPAAELDMLAKSGAVGRSP